MHADHPMDWHKAIPLLSKQPVSSAPISHQHAAQSTGRADKRMGNKTASGAATAYVALKNKPRASPSARDIRADASSSSPAVAPLRGSKRARKPVQAFQVSDRN